MITNLAIMEDFNINHFVGEEMEPNDFVPVMNSSSFSPVILSANSNHYRNLNLFG